MQVICIRSLWKWFEVGSEYEVTKTYSSIYRGKEYWYYMFEHTGDVVGFRVENFAPFSTIDETKIVNQFEIDKVMNQTTNQILDIFEGYRMAPTSIDQYESVGKRIFGERIDAFVAAKSPIGFAMLGLPFKSINKRDKVLGDLPDLGEELTVKNFAAFNAAVKTVYEPGIEMLVASDGYVFNDLLGAPDYTVEQYKEINSSFNSNGPLKILDLNDFYTGPNIATKRDRLMQQFGYTWEKMEQEILFNPDVNMLYKGMLLFMEEELAWQDFPSRNQRAKAAKKLVREMMLRNEAYNQLVRKELSGHIRLSMHQSVNNGYKYSFKLIPGNKTHHSAWHCVIVMQGDEAITMHRIEAEKAGYELVYKDGQPYNFISNSF